MRSQVTRPIAGARSAKDLVVYHKAYALAMFVFETSKGSPASERHSLTDQMRRAARSTCANLREAWAKRRYEAHFISKLTDADDENAETDTWLDFALSCGYIETATHAELTSVTREVGAMLGSILKNPHPFVLKSQPAT